ncbi:MAG: AbrB/MazE/SpoVT family DNA-binding domain-containing protein [Thermoleophilaceae bacterium]|nr:AbrB/MazE/SpoVT family DNA-binding domain-containing protein [Thermoleophilaceae bacterium]
MKARVSDKGQVTIPKRLRERLGIRAGEVLELEEEDGRIVASKASDRDPVDELYGTLALPGGVDEFIAGARGG